MGCENNQYSQDSTAGLSKECALLEKDRQCLSNIDVNENEEYLQKEMSKCFFTAGIILIGTRHESFIDKLISEQVTDSEALKKEAESLLSGKENNNAQDVVYEKFGHLIEKNKDKHPLIRQRHFVIDLKKHYSCPPTTL